MSANIRYNLRNRASGPRPGVHSGLAPLPGSFQNPSSRGSDSAPSDGEHSDASSVASSARSSSVRPGVSYSQATSHRVGANTASLSDQEANPRVSGADTVPSNGREAYPCNNSPQSGTVGASSLSSSGKENIFPSTPSRQTSSSLTTMNIVSEDANGNGQWTEVRRKKDRARSLDSATPRELTPPRAAVVPPAGTALLNDEQQRAVNAAEKSLSKEERGRIEKRMRAVNNPRDQSASRGEGPSTMAKGKAVDARNWGAVDIDPSELDPKAQRRAFAQFSARDPSDYYNSDEDSEDEREAQEAALQYYAAIKAAKRRPKPTVRTTTDESDRNQTAHRACDVSNEQMTSHTSSHVEATSHEDLARQITALRKELADVRRAHSTSEKLEWSQTPLQRSNQPTASHATSREAGTAASDAETARADESISKALKASRKHSKHKSRAKKAKQKAAPASHFTDPSQGMATAIVEKALQPGRSNPGIRPSDGRRLPQPISQLEPTSFINRTLRHMSDGPDNKGSPSSSSSSSSSGSSDPSDSSGLSDSSSNSSDDSDPSSDESSNSSDSSSRRNRRRRHKHRRGSKRRHSSRKRRHAKHKSSRTVPVLKPVDPEKYFGNPDLAEFHRFINQAQDYLDGYRVKPRKHGSVIARFLDGRAHEFYVNTVSRNPREWPFKKILVGLFNYCFPINFRQKTREKLRNIRQAGRSVQTYVYELENLFLILGMDRNEERVDAFWFGLDKYIQGELWKQMMTLQSPYDDVKARAQVIELAREATEGRGSRPHHNDRQRHRDNAPGPNYIAARQGARQDDRQAGHGRGPRGRLAFRRDRNQNHRGDRGDREQAIFVGNMARAPANGHQRDRQPRRNAPNHRQQPPRRDRRASPRRPRHNPPLPGNHDRCFNCGEPGHMARNCPRARQVRSNNRDAPPGVATYNMEVILEDTEALRGLAESTASTGEVHLNSIEFDYSVLPSLRPAWELIARDFIGPFTSSQAPVSMGDRSEHDSEEAWDDMPALQSVSDTLSDLSECDEDIMSGVHTMSGTSSSSGGDCPIPVEDDSIRVSEADLEELEFPRTRADGATQYALGDVFEQRAQQVLNMHRPYWKGQSTDPEHEFFIVSQVSDTQYAIECTAIDLDVYVTAEQLQNGSLDLPSMYRSVLRDVHVEGELDVLDGTSEPLGDAMALVLEQQLNETMPYPAGSGGDVLCPRFRCFQLGEMVEILDNYLAASTNVSCDILQNPCLDFRDWYAHAMLHAHSVVDPPFFELDDLEGELVTWFKLPPSSEQVEVAVELYTAQPGKQSWKEEDNLTIQWNAAVPRDLR